jgi:hypothetical protein
MNLEFRDDLRMSNKIVLHKHIFFELNLSTQPALLRSGRSTSSFNNADPGTPLSVQLAINREGNLCRSPTFDLDSLLLHSNPTSKESSRYQKPATLLILCKENSVQIYHLNFPRKHASTTASSGQVPALSILLSYVLLNRNVMEFLDTYNS